jgi:hypothetical protein
MPESFPTGEGYLNPTGKTVMDRKLALGMAMLALACAGTARAHHSAAAFDAAREAVIEGVVTRFDWRSPHVYLTVRDRHGTEWLVEGGPPGVLARNGWNRDSLRAKQPVIVRGRPHRDPARHELLFVSITGPGGGALPLGKAWTPPAQASSAATLGGLWVGDAASLGPFVQKLLAHPLTEAGRSARASFRPGMDPAAQCVAWTSPFIVLASVIYPTRIELRGSTAVFHSEFYDTRRVVHLDRREHPAHGKPTPQGDSVGWWEGRTLVVDTRLFAPTRSQFRDPYAGLPSGADKHVVERYTLGEDGTTLAVEIRMEDPEYLAEPLSGSFLWRYAPDLPFVGAKCDPKSAQRFLR